VNSSHGQLVNGIDYLRKVAMTMDVVHTDL